MALKLTASRSIGRVCGVAPWSMGTSRSMATQATVQLPELPYSYR